MIESDWDMLCNHTDELMATGLHPGRHEAMLEAQRRNPHLDRTPPGMKPMTPTSRPMASGNAEAELDRQARQLEREDRITYAAYQRALIANPRLCIADLEQHPARPERADPTQPSLSASRRLSFAALEESRRSWPCSGCHSDPACDAGFCRISEGRRLTARSRLSR